MKKFFILLFAAMVFMVVGKMALAEESAPKVVRPGETVTVPSGTNIVVEIPAPPPAPRPKPVFIDDPAPPPAPPAPPSRSVRPEVGAFTGVHSANLAVGLDVGLGLSLTRQFELVGALSGSYQEGRRLASEAEVGLGWWADDVARLSLSAGLGAVRNNAFQQEALGPYGSAKLDIVPLGRKAGGIKFTLRGGGGPSWTNGELGGQWMLTLGVGWLAGE